MDISIALPSDEDILWFNLVSQAHLFMYCCTSVGIWVHNPFENLKIVIFTIPGIIQGTCAVGDRVGMMGTILEFCLPHNATRPCLFSPQHCQITKIGWNFNDEVSVAQFKKTFHRNKHIVLLEAGKNRVILSALIYQ